MEKILMPRKKAGRLNVRRKKNDYNEYNWIFFSRLFLMMSLWRQLLLSIRLGSIFVSLIDWWWLNNAYVTKNYTSNRRVWTAFLSSGSHWLRVCAWHRIATSVPTCALHVQRIWQWKFWRIFNGARRENSITRMGAFPWWAWCKRYVWRNFFHFRQSDIHFGIILFLY